MPNKKPARTEDWYVYMLRCADHSLYTGITKDIDRRLHEHNSDNRLAAKYTRARRPVSLIYQELFDTKSDALKREYAIKQLGKLQKEALIKKQ